MKNISYFKLQAKNLYRDFKLDFMQDDEAYTFSPNFFDVNKIVSDFDIDCDDFSLMKSQHIIAKLVGFNSWNELIKSSDDLLEHKKDILENSNIKVKKKKVYHIDLSGYKRVGITGKMGDYILKCPKLEELREIISTLKPDSYFLSCSLGDGIFEKMSSDKENFYVNVIPKTSSIRVFVPGMKYPDWYAVSVKNII